MNSYPHWAPAALVEEHKRLVNAPRRPSGQSLRFTQLLAKLIDADSHHMASVWKALERRAETFTISPPSFFSYWNADLRNYRDEIIQLNISKESLSSWEFRFSLDIFDCSRPPSRVDMMPLVKRGNLLTGIADDLDAIAKRAEGVDDGWELFGAISVACLAKAAFISKRDRLESDERNKLFRSIEVLRDFPILTELNPSISDALRYIAKVVRDKAVHPPTVDAGKAVAKGSDPNVIAFARHLTTKMVLWWGLPLYEHTCSITQTLFSTENLTAERVRAFAPNSEPEEISFPTHPLDSAPPAHKRRKKTLL